MTNEEKRKLATARELEELRKVVQNFDSVVESARRLADDCRDSLARFQAIEREDKIDQAIDELDYQMRRGKYADTLTEAHFAANPPLEAVSNLIRATFPKS